MTRLKLLPTVAFLSALAAAAPSLAQARSHHRYAHSYGLPYEISYNHNYGPGLQPGTFAYYDGPSTNACRQSSATYIGQDRRRYPCF